MGTGKGDGEDADRESGMAAATPDSVPPRADMHRRDFLRLGLLAPLAALTTRMDASSLPAPTTPAHHRLPNPDGKSHRFELTRLEFLLAGRVFVIHSGGMHPIRIPRASTGATASAWAKPWDSIPLACT